MVFKGGMMFNIGDIVKVPSHFFKQKVDGTSGIETETIYNHYLVIDETYSGHLTVHLETGTVQPLYDPEGAEVVA